MPKDAELLIMDDGSSDGTTEYLTQVDSPSIRVLRHEASRGIAESLNALLACSESLFVARIDADDVCLPWRFSLQEGQMEGVDFLFSSVIRMSTRGVPRLRPLTYVPISVQAAPMHLLLGNYLAHTTMFARRTALVALGGYRDSAIEDFDLWLRAATQGFRIRRSGIPTVLYREHQQQLTRQVSRKDTRIYAESFAELLNRELPTTWEDPEGLLRVDKTDRGYLTHPQAQEFEMQLRKKAKDLPLGERLLFSLRMRMQGS